MYAGRPIQRSIRCEWASLAYIAKYYNFSSVYKSAIEVDMF